jgi:putative (di)nucleoside polyphosphate hydrolase
MAARWTARSIVDSCRAAFDDRKDPGAPPSKIGYNSTITPRGQYLCVLFLGVGFEAGLSTVKPLRDNVGIALFNASGRVLIARRFEDDGPEIISKGYEWQMPQGGIGLGERPVDAAMRELHEETAVTSAEYLAETEWYSYEFPPYVGPADHRLAQFRGQRQKWFAFRFIGADDDVDVTVSRNGEPPEFDAWRWERLEQLPDLVVPFKREVYRHVARAFSTFAR